MNKVNPELINNRIEIAITKARKILADGNLHGMSRENSERLCKDVREIDKWQERADKAQAKGDTAAVSFANYKIQCRREDIRNLITYKMLAYED